MPAPVAVLEHYRVQQAASAKAVGLARRVWARFNAEDLDGSWERLSQRLVVAAASGQVAAAEDAEGYLGAVLAETGQRDRAVARVQPAGFAGWASDGRPLDSLLRGAVVRVKESAAAGVVPARAMRAGRDFLDLAVATQVQDAGRQAVSAGMVARPDVAGYVRMVNPPACQRCAILAGRWYRVNEGFLRHPRCDCRHVPSSERLASGLMDDPNELARSGGIKDLTAAQRAALEEGADLGRLVNAYRRDTRSGLGLTDGKGARGRRRLTPEGIYQRAGDDRAEMVRLLRVNGYLTD